MSKNQRRPWMWFGGLLGVAIVRILGELPHRSSAVADYRDDIWAGVAWGLGLGCGVIAGMNILSLSSQFIFSRKARAQCWGQNKNNANDASNVTDGSTIQLSQLSASGAAGARQSRDVAGAESAVAAKRSIRAQGAFKIIEPSNDQSSSVYNSPVDQDIRWMSGSTTDETRTEDSSVHESFSVSKAGAATGAGNSANASNGAKSNGVGNPGSDSNDTDGNNDKWTSTSVDSTYNSLSEKLLTTMAGGIAGIWLASAVGVLVTLSAPLTRHLDATRCLVRVLTGVRIDQQQSMGEFAGRALLGSSTGIGVLLVAAALNWAIETIDSMGGDD